MRCFKGESFVISSAIKHWMLQLVNYLLLAKINKNNFWSLKWIFSTNLEMVKPFTPLSEGDSWTERVNLSLEGSRIFPPLQQFWRKFSLSPSPDTLPAVPTTQRPVQRKKSDRYTVCEDYSPVVESDLSSSCSSYSPALMAGFRQRFYWPPMTLANMGSVSEKRYYKFWN